MTKILPGVVERETEIGKSEHFKNCSETKNDFKCCRKKTVALRGGQNNGFPSQDVHVLIPESVNMLGYMARGS